MTQCDSLFLLSCSTNESSNAGGSCITPTNNEGEVSRREGIGSGGGLRAVLVNVVGRGGAPTEQNGDSIIEVAVLGESDPTKICTKSVSVRRFHLLRALLPGCLLPATA